MFERRTSLPILLSFSAGYVDAASFVAFRGLFTAHVTGNFVTLGASLIQGTSGALAKLLALPVFCVAVIATRLLNTALSNRHWLALELLIALKVLLLVAGAALAIHFGPFNDVDSAQAVGSGMVLVSAMAIQNAVHRIHLGSMPPSTIMTGTTTQVMIDLADRIHAPQGVESQSGARLVQMSTSILVFAMGCGAAALLYSRLGVECFMVPPIVGILQLIVLRVSRERAPEPSRRTGS
jgi:uncharacterized membrane protein YoaK (UPF0700 family)